MERRAGTAARPGANGRAASVIVALAAAWALLVLLPAAAFGDGLEDRGLRKAELDLRLEKTRVIRELSYRHLPRIGPNGEMGANLDEDRPFSVAHQQLGDLYVRAGIVRRKPRLIKKGLRAFDYAFLWQEEDGSFPAHQAEAYAFFVEAVAHSIELLRETRYADRHEERLDDFVSRLREAAFHMVEKEAWRAFVERNQWYTHSGYTMGTALSLTGRLSHSRRLRRHGMRAIRLAVSRQWDDGVNPEIGGYDVRYQMAGLVWAERFAVYFPNRRLASRVERMTDRALEWMRPRVDRDGWIDWRGSTRACQEVNSNGNPKSPGYAYAVRGFAYWGRLTGSRPLIREGRRIYDYLESHGGDGSLCVPKWASTARAAQAERRGGGALRGARLDDLYE